MAWRAQFMHGLNQGPDSVWGDPGLDAVAEIEDMARTGAKISQDLRDLLADAVGGGVQHGWVEIAL